MRVPKSKLWRILPPLLLSLMFLPNVLADFSDGFDTYPSGTVNPGPWTMVNDSGVCWPVANVLSTYSAKSPPNVYQFSFAGSCAGTAHYANMTATINATSAVLNFTFYADGVSASGGSGTLTTYICPATGYCPTADAVGASIVLTSIPVTFTEYHALNGIVITPGSSYRVRLAFKVTSSLTGSFILNFDNTLVKGGNVVIPGANLFLVDYPSQQWFNISGYAGSTLRINYDVTTNCASWYMIQASPNVCLMDNLQVPDLKVSLTGAVLITVGVGGPIGYSRTIIPQPNLLHTATSPKETMYLNDISSPTPCPGICSYTLTVNDFTGFYPTGTTEGFITQGNFTMTSALLDAQSAIAMTMVPGLYNLTLISAGGLHAYSSPLTLTATDSAPQVLIQNGSSPITIGPFQQFSYSASWDCNLGGITSTIQDSLGTMTTEVFQLYRYNSTYPGGVVVASHTSVVSGAPGFTVSYDFTNSTYGVRNINSSTPNEYAVAYNLSPPTENFGQFPVGYSPTCSNLPRGVGLAGIFRLPTSVLGLNALFSASNAYEFIFSIIIVIMTVGIMGARMGHMAMLVMGGEVGILSLMGWLPPGAAILAPIFLFMGALGVLTNRSRRPIT